MPSGVKGGLGVLESQEGWEPEVSRKIGRGGEKGDCRQRLASTFRMLELKQCWRRGLGSPVYLMCLGKGEFLLPGLS